MDVGLLVLRVIGVTFAAHGFQKLFGWFDGGGFDGTAAWFDSLGFNGRRAAFLAGATEVSAGLGLATGTLTPVAAAGVIGVMTVAGLVNSENGFWSVNKGWELNYILVIWAIALAMTGPGRWSIDHLLGIDFASPLVGLIVAIVGLAGAGAQWASRDRSKAEAA